VGDGGVVKYVLVGEGRTGARAAGSSNGERVEIEKHDGDIVIRRQAPRFTLDERFRGKSAEEWRAAYRGVFDWGPDIGREAVDE
jgi:hypothetical protein